MADLSTPQTMRTRAPALPVSRLGAGRLSALLIVFFSGMNLILIQWVMVREVTTLLLGTELVILLASISYFVGVSIGYGLAGHIRGRRLLTVLGTATLILHLTLPISLRLLVAGAGAAQAYWLAFLIIPLLTPFIVSMFYSVFLPHFVDSGGASLGSLYATELLGTICGIGVLFFLSGLGLQTVDVVYSVGLIAILLSLGLRRRVALVLALASALWIAALPALNDWSNTLWYRHLVKLPEGTMVLYSAYSPYQKVDVLELPDGERSLYLDGLEHFNGEDGVRLNVVIAEIPALLMQPANSLVVGAGTMQSEALIAAQGGHVTTVEIDPVVAEAGERYFHAYNHMDTLTNRTVIVDDAKHFLATTSDRYDLIVGDTPAAFSIQTATLYSTSFYQMARERLTPNGIVAANLTSPFTPDDTVSRRVAASLLEVFDNIIIVTPESVGWSFAYAADTLPFTREELEQALRESGETQFSVFDTAAVRQIVGDAPPITLDSMDLVLQTSADWIGDRLAWGRE
jgi:spermidine synthase